MSDPHASISPIEARARGCTCEFGCRSCGYPREMMGNCPALAPCPMGRAPDPACPLTKRRTEMDTRLAKLYTLEGEQTVVVPPTAYGWPLPEAVYAAPYGGSYVFLAVEEHGAREILTGLVLEGEVRMYERGSYSKLPEQEGTLVMRGTEYHLVEDQHPCEGEGCGMPVEGLEEEMPYCGPCLTERLHTLP